MWFNVFISLVLTEQKGLSNLKKNSDIHSCYKKPMTLVSPPLWGWKDANQYPKSKLVPGQPIKAHRGCRGIAPLILNLSTGWRWVVNFTLQLAYPWERTPVSSRQEVMKMLHIKCATPSLLHFTFSHQPSPCTATWFFKSIIHPCIIKGTDFNPGDSVYTVNNEYIENSTAITLVTHPHHENVYTIHSHLKCALHLAYLVLL
jgi:hypothetical protein